MAGPRLDASLAHYRELAPRYDAATRRINAIRVRAIDALALRPGDCVIDAGCGTGWCFERIAAAVGPSGRLLAFDPSGEMLAQARTRAASLPCPSDIVQATGEDARFDAPADAVLFSYTHDLLRSRAALRNVLRQSRPGARVAATSTKLYAPWLAPANWYLRATHRGYITDFEGFRAPWSILAELLDEFRVDTHPWSQHYVATGRVPQEAR